MNDLVTHNGKTLARVFYTHAGEKDRRAHEEFFEKHGAQCEGDFFHYVDPAQLYHAALNSVCPPVQTFFDEVAERLSK